MRIRVAGNQADNLELPVHVKHDVINITADSALKMIEKYRFPLHFPFGRRKTVISKYDLTHADRKSSAPVWT